MLKYTGKDGAYIEGVPRRDLTDGDIQDIAERWQLPILETEALLSKRGVFSAIGTAEAVDESSPKKTIRKKGE